MAALRPCDTQTVHQVHPWGAGPPHYVCPGIQPAGPDCRDGKHPACDGRALDDSTDEITECACRCHTLATDSNRKEHT